MKYIMLKLFENLFGYTTRAIKKAISNGAVILDVRTPEEYEAGHIEPSRNIPLEKLRNSLTLIKSFHQPVITVGPNDNLSELAKKLLSGAGIEAYNGGSWMHLKEIMGMNH